MIRSLVLCDTSEPASLFPSPDPARPSSDHNLSLFLFYARIYLILLCTSVLCQIDYNAFNFPYTMTVRNTVAFPSLPANAHCVYIHGVQHKITSSEEGNFLSQSALDCSGYAALTTRFQSIEVFAHDTLSEDEINDLANRFSEIKKYDLFCYDGQLPIA